MFYSYKIYFQTNKTPIAEISIINTFGGLIISGKYQRMKKILFVLLVLLSIIYTGYSQSLENTGKPVGEIFSDFHYNINDTLKTTGFGINRAHLGYHYTIDGDFSATIMVNIGTPEDLADGSVPKRYAYFREASVTYKKNKLTVNFGMVNTRYASFQQAFWGKRYLGPEFQAAYPYGSVADLGIVADYTINDIIKADLSILNGKGYTNIQFDNSIKTALGLLITTPNNISIRLYGDIMKPHGVVQTTLIAFASLKNDLFSLGAEASYKTNLDYIKGDNVWGLSATGAIFLSKKTEIFVRYDYAASVVAPYAELQWDYLKDGTYFIGGLQHTVNQNLRFALNFRRTNPYNPGQKTTDAIFLNAHFKF